MKAMPTEIEISAFKHVVVPLGVVIGMGVAHIVTSLTSYLNHRKNVQFSYTHGVWTAITSFWLIGLWWILWQYRLVEAHRWSFFSLTLLLVGPAILYLAVSLLLPSIRSGEVLELDTRFDQVGRPFFICLFGVILWLGATELLLLRQEFVEPHRFGQIAAAILLGVGSAIPSRRTAKILGVLFLILTALTFATFRAGLG